MNAKVHFLSCEPPLGPISSDGPRIFVVGSSLIPRGKHRNDVRANKQHRWRGLPQIASTGYVKLHVGKDHALAASKSYTYAHLIISVSAGHPRPRRGQLLHFKKSSA
jgi:hypothetical protein